MSVKLMPRLASTGPAVKTRKSTTNGDARIHPATAWPRRVGSTTFGGRAEEVTVLMSEPGADRLRLGLHLLDRVVTGQVATRCLLDEPVDRGRDLLPRGDGGGRLRV